MNTPRDGQAFHGITDTMVADVPDLATVFAEFTELVGEPVLLDITPFPTFDSCNLKWKGPV